MDSAEETARLVQGREQPKCPSTDEWIKKMWHIYTKEYHPARKLNELESVLVRWMNLLYRVK